LTLLINDANSKLLDASDSNVQNEHVRLNLPKKTQVFATIIEFFKYHRIVASNIIFKEQLKIVSQNKVCRIGNISKMPKSSIILMNRCRSVSVSFSSTSKPPLKPISFVSATRAPLKPISASVTKNLEHLENLDGFVPGHQHHQHGMSSGGGHGGHGGGQAGNYLLNGM
jgi:hypothetical protein